MTSSTSLTRRLLGSTAAKLGVAAAAVSLGTTAAFAATAGASTASHTAAAKSFSFRLKPSSPGIAACMPHARGKVTITPGAENDVMKVSLHGMVPKQTFALFVLEQPAKPFGLAWYQTDVDTNSRGNGSATVRGVFDRETFSVSTGGPTATFAPTHMFHIGVWFDAVRLPFNIGCEPGATTPVVTPFDGDHNAGPQALNTAQFPVKKGPLSHVH